MLKKLIGAFLGIFLPAYFLLQFHVVNPWAVAFAVLFANACGYFEDKL